MKGQDLGRAASVVMQFHRQCNAAYEEAAGYGAPGECYPLIARGQARAFRFVRRQVKAITGLKWRDYCREVRRRTSDRYVYFSPVCREPYLAAWAWAMKQPGGNEAKAKEYLTKVFANVAVLPMNAST